MAQIVSNFANEYFDFRNGLDRKGRDGFRRGVTEGDITPAAMRNATFGLLAATCAVGCSLIFWGRMVACLRRHSDRPLRHSLFSRTISLSHHGLGDIAVVIFFGIVPVIMTTYIQTGSWEMIPVTLPVSLVAVGLMGANVLIVNNYRDMDEDKAVGKKTTVVIFGRKKMATDYLLNGFIALALIEYATIATLPVLWQIGMLVYINIHYLLWTQLRNGSGKQLNPLLGKTAMLMLFVSAWLLASMSFR